MAARQTLDNLARQKQLLLAEAELHRCILATELQRIRRPLNWLNRSRFASDSWRSIILLAAPVAGLLLGRKRSGIGYWLSRALAGFRVLREVTDLVVPIRDLCRKRQQMPSKGQQERQPGIHTEL
jgi:hypothetical protein